MKIRSESTPLTRLSRPTETPRADGALCSDPQELVSLGQQRPDQKVQTQAITADLSFPAPALSQSSAAELAPLLDNALQQTRVRAMTPLGPMTMDPDVQNLFPLLDSANLRIDKLGAQPAVREGLQDLIGALKDGTSPPYNRILIEGNAGDGKSSWLRALAGELYPMGISTLHADGSDFDTDGPTRVRKLFAEAQRLASQSPKGVAVIAMDDIEPVTRIRSSDAGAINTHQHQLLAAFCEQMDQAKNVVVVATASRSDTMDYEGQGRFQQKLGLRTPADKHERYDVLQGLVKQQHLSVSDEVLKEIAAATGGSNAGQLKDILRMAQLAGGPDGITSASAREARLEKAYGPAGPVNNPDWMLRLTALHELGHLVVRSVFEDMAIQGGHPDHMPKGVDAVSFAPRGGAAAAVFLKPSGNPTRTFEWYFAEVSSNMAGRAAESRFGKGHMSAGPGNDIRHATSLLQEAVREKGMGQSLGPINPTIGDSPEFLARAQQDEERLMKSADRVGASIVNYYAPVMEQIADGFVANRNDTSKLTVSGDEIKRQFSEWENADPARRDQVKTLQQWIRHEMEGLRYQPPTIFDPVSQRMVAQS